ncbi:MAG: TolC family protein [Balneolaceae bacterium]
MIPRILLLAILLTIPFISNAQTAITIEDAIQIALENNYQLKQAENNLSLSDNDILSAKADFLPSVSASYNATRRIGQQFDQTTVTFENVTTNSMGGNLNSGITLFNGFSNIVNLRRANTNKEIQIQESQRLRENIIFTTASRFLQVILNEELLRISRENLSVSRQQYEQIEAQVEVGRSPSVDLLNQASLVANDELLVIQRENALENSITFLMRIMQDDSGRDYELIMPEVSDLNLIPIELNLEEMVETAMNNRRDLRAQELLIERNEFDESLARANLLPTLNASFGISGSYNERFRDIDGSPLSFGEQFFDRNVNRFIGFSLQIPIFDNLSRRTSLQSTKINLRNSRLELDNIKYQINEEVRQAYTDYQSIVKELESSNTALIASERAYETEVQRYEVGASTLIELNQANANFVEAQSNRIQTIYNFVFQEKVLEFYLGRLTASMDL